MKNFKEFLNENSCATVDKETGNQLTTKILQLISVIENFCKDKNIKVSFPGKHAETIMTFVCDWLHSLRKDKNTALINDSDKSMLDFVEKTMFIISGFKDKPRPFHNSPSNFLVLCDGKISY